MINSLEIFIISETIKVYTLKNIYLSCNITFVLSCEFPLTSNIDRSKCVN